MARTAPTKRDFIVTLLKAGVQGSITVKAFDADHALGVAAQAVNGWATPLRAALKTQEA